jgi:hypothetical protein
VSRDEYTQWCDGWANCSGKFSRAKRHQEKKYDVAILRLLSYIDSILISEKVMPSDFAVVVARKKEKLCTLEKNRWEEVNNPKIDHQESYPSSAWNMFRRSLRKKYPASYDQKAINRNCS